MFSSTEGIEDSERETRTEKQTCFLLEVKASPTSEIWGRIFILHKKDIMKISQMFHLSAPLPFVDVDPSTDCRCRSIHGHRIIYKSIAY